MQTSFPERKPQALVFDMDGTMIANKQYHDEAWIRFCETYKQDADISDFIHKYAGKTNDAILKLVFQSELSVEEIRRYEDIKEAMYRALFAPHFKLVDGLPELLQWAKANNYRIAIATSAPRVNVDFVIQTANIHHYFDAIVDSSMVSEGKPSPEVFLKAAKALGVEPSGCICFEDSRAGIAASLAAGMNTIGIATDLSVTELLQLGAHEAFPDFEAFSRSSMLMKSMVV